jgi:hypothetical protein
MAFLSLFCSVSIQLGIFCSLDNAEEDEGPPALQRQGTGSPTAAMSKRQGTGLGGMSPTNTKGGGKGSLSTCSLTPICAC